MLEKMEKEKRAWRPKNTKIEENERTSPVRSRKRELERMGGGRLKSGKSKQSMREGDSGAVNLDAERARVVKEYR